MEKNKIVRSCRFTLEFSNRGKRLFLERLCEEYKKVVNYILDVGAKEGRFPNVQDIKSYPEKTFLSMSYRYSAFIRAYRILKVYFKSKEKFERRGKTVKTPKFKGDSVKLYKRFFKLERGRNSFDFWLKLRDPGRKRWVCFPIKSYKYAKKYFEGWELRPTIEIVRQGGKWYLILFFEKAVRLENKEPKGLKIGYRKLVTTSDGKFYGENIKEIIEKQIDTKKQGSKNWKRKKMYLKSEINRVLKQVVDGSFSPVFERLSGLKNGKKGKWARHINRKFNNWIYFHILKRIVELCEVAGVQWHTVPSQYTSRTCPMCKYRSKLNRKRDIFLCRQCGYRENAYIVGARNILLRFTGESWFPLPAKPT